MYFCKKTESMTKNCVNCGNPFESCRDSNIFCSKKCNNNSRSKKVIKEISEEIAGEENIFQESKEREIKTNDVLHNVPDDITGWKTRAFSTNKDGEVVTTWRRAEEGIGFVLTDEVKQFIKEGFLDIKPFTFIVNNKPKSVKTQIFWISDMHVGSCNFNPQYGSSWTLERVEERVLSLVEHVVETDELIIVNLGDSLDGLQKKTTRGGHLLDQSLDDRQMMIGVFQVFQKLFTVLSELQKNGTVNKIRFISTGESNHTNMDGILGFFISEWLKVKYPLIESQIAISVIDKFESHEHIFLFLHGKDSRHARNGVPLHLDLKTEVYFRRLFDEMGVVPSDKTHIYSGDLHREAFDKQKFTYNKVACLASPSDWAQVNFASNDSGLSYTKILNNSFTEKGLIIFEN